MNLRNVGPYVKAMVYMAAVYGNWSALSCDLFEP